MTGIAGAGQGGCAPNLFRSLQNVLVIQFLPGLFQEVLAYFLVPLGRCTPCHRP